ncbi:hypothetical protein I0C86_41445 [Plantactinospora sp. S1510]|uniref:Minor tail protein n=1 Tax=Plantactinospora alkalitolerans TaxID=2789879 RepID=A0ABS0HA08_9ACTN|nr:hypothetical protein [Plantactinospora alkalitolerans]MBF9135318.1 hypothetical protein [Plantactinospora alkalitolerans]
MDISLTTEAWTVEKRDWLGSRDGTEFTRTITLHLASFTANVHYPNGFIPSGIVIAKITSGTGTGLYGPYAGSTSEAQTVTITGTPTGGTFTLTWDGQTSGAIAYNATASAVQTALEAMSNINPGDVSVSGGPGPGTPYVVAFAGRYVGDNVPQMTASGASLTGGSSPAVGVTTTTAGGSGSSNGLEIPDGFLFNSTHVRSTRNLGAPLHWRGVIRTSKLPAGNGLDANARDVLGAKFRFEA